MTALDPNGLAAEHGPEALRQALDKGSAKSRDTSEAPSQNGDARPKRQRRGRDEGTDSDMPVIRVVAGKMPLATDKAERALLDAGTPIFRRAGMLVRPVIDQIPAADGKMTIATRLRPMCVPSMRDCLAQIATFQRFDGRRKAWTDIDPPEDLAKTLLVRDGQWRLPSIAGIITTPTLRPDGSLLTEAGYDAATQLYLAPDGAFRLPPIPERPTRADAEAALQLLKDLLAGFPVLGEVDRAVALSGIITAVVRGALPTAPLYAIRSPTPGTGKSLLVDVAATIATGRICPVIAAGRTEDETEKRLGALLLAGDPIISLDNVNGELRGDTLCQMTERPVVRVRILG